MMPTETEARNKICTYFLQHSKRLDSDYLDINQKSALQEFALEWKNIKAQMDWMLHLPGTSESKRFLSDLMISAPYCLDYFLSTHERKMFLEQALGVARRHRDELAESRLLGDLGLIDSALEDHLQGGSFQRQRIVLARELGDERGECVALTNLGDDYNSLSDRLGYLPTALVVADASRDLNSYPFYAVQALRCFKRAHRLSRKLCLPAQEARALRDGIGQAWHI